MADKKKTGEMKEEGAPKKEETGTHIIEYDEEYYEEIPRPTKSRGTSSTLDSDLIIDEDSDPNLMEGEEGNE